MPLLLANEYSPANLMADLALQRSAVNQLTLQLITLEEGINLPISPTVGPTRQGLQQYEVGVFETLPSISTKIYGEPDYWVQLAEANDLDYPYIVTPGQLLTLPEVAR